MPLKNCVNDAVDMAVVLEKVFGYSRKNGVAVRLLTDNRATTSNIIERLEWLVGADQWVLFQSGHGTQMADRNGDELDNLDELFCPVDFDWDVRSLINDDDYSRIFRKGNPNGKGLFISDSCHSGDLARYVMHDAAIKAYPPPADIKWRNHQAVESGLSPRRLGSDLPPGVTAISACRSDQVAMDGNPEDGKNGAFTWAFLKILQKYPGNDLSDIVRRTNTLLSANGYRQEPQLAGSDGAFPCFVEG